MGDGLKRLYSEQLFSEGGVQVESTVPKTSIGLPPCADLAWATTMLYTGACFLPNLASRILRTIVFELVVCVAVRLFQAVVEFLAMAEGIPWLGGFMSSMIASIDDELLFSTLTKARNSHQLIEKLFKINRVPFGS